MIEQTARRIVETARDLGPHRTRVVLDRPGGNALTLAVADARVGEERPDYMLTAHWVMCDIRLASGLIVEGSLRLTPPQPGKINPKITRATGIIAHIEGKHVDLVNNGERQRVRLPGHEAFPLRVRISATPPNPVTGLVHGHPDDELPMGTWSRGLNPVDFAVDVEALSRKI
jgi:hypothetical protein